MKKETAAKTIRPAASTPDHRIENSQVPGVKKRVWLRRVLFWVGGGIATVLLLLVIASFAVDEPLRAYLERQMNSKVEGYSFRLGKLDFHPFGFAIDLENLVVTQNSAPDPPVASIQKWHASMEWTALLWGRLVNNQRFVKPVLHITTTQAKKEAEDEIPVEKRGWQDAVEAVYPFKINEIVIEDGEITYLDEATPPRTIHIGNVNLTATNIRNVRSKDREYPSTIHLEGELFDKGKLLIEGHADFMQEPIPGINAEFHLGATPIEDLRPLLGRINLQLRKGTLAGEGAIEYSPKVKIVQLKKLEVDGVQLDYVHSPKTQMAEKERTHKAYETGKELTEHEEIVILVDHLKMTNCNFGYVNQSTVPPYRVFLTQVNMELENFSNQLTAGVSTLKLRSKFMDSGNTLVTGVIRPNGGSPDFTMAVKIEDVRMETMNDIWRAYGKFDVTYGLFSFYSELTIKNKTIQGYVKPLFKDVVVYDPQQDRKKGTLRKMYEAVLGDLAVLLENPQRQEVATKTPVSGNMENPQTDLIETVLRLVQNAFFKAILPGLERNIGRKQ